MTFKPLILALALTALAPAIGYAQNRDINLEPECSDSGSGMDPRCVGDTNPGTITDATTAQQEEMTERGVPVVAMRREGRAPVMQER